MSQHPPLSARHLTWLLLALLTTAPAWAASPDIVLRYGSTHGDYERLGVGIRLAPFWSDTWGAWTAEVRPEIEASHFRYTGSSAGPDSLEQGGVIAHFRATRRSAGGWRPYAEAGLGVSMFSDDRLGAKSFSTHFQFSEHLGLGMEFGRRAFAGWQYSHYSNADIDEPNDGIDLHQLAVGLHF